MEHFTNNQRIENIINNNGGYITNKDVLRHNIPSIYLSRYIKKYNLKKCCSGFYARKNWIQDDFLILQYQYPKLIFSFLSASYLLQLGDNLPGKFEVTGPKNYRPFHTRRANVILHTDTREGIYGLGIVEVKNIFGNIVKVYDAEKTVCDFIRNRKRIDTEVFIKCMNYYKKRKNKNINNLVEYSRKMKIENEVNSIMEFILNDD